MLLYEGVSRGWEPTVSVLEIAPSTKRQPSDLLPFLGAFARFFRRLPATSADIKFRMATVPLGDLECVTKTIMKVQQPFIFLRLKAKTPELTDDVDEPCRCGAEQRSAAAAGGPGGIHPTLQVMD